MDAERCFLEALIELQSAYSECTFFVERDVVWTMQLRLRDRLKPGWRVFNDYGLLPGPRRALSADLVILNSNDELQLAAEFKYEPCRRRTDIQAKKLPVIGWNDVHRDAERLVRFVEESGVPAAYGICVDEGGRYAGRTAPAGAWREHWDTGYETLVTITRYPSRTAAG